MNGYPITQHEKDNLKILDPATALKALADLIETIENTGGIVWCEHSGFQVPAGDQEWSDLTHPYLAACAAVGRTPMVQPEETDDG